MDFLNFGQPNPNKEAEKMQVRAEQRQKQAQDEQNTFAIASNPDEDQIYMQQQELRSDFLKWQQDLDDSQYKLIMTLLGYNKNFEGNWEQTKKAMCNEKFIYEVVIPQTDPFMSRNMINSSFSEEQILSDLKNTSDDIVAAMANNFDKYEIDFIDFDLVLRLIKNTIKPGSFRALQGWTKKLDSTVIRRVEATQERTGDDKEKKLFGMF